MMTIDIDNYQTEANYLYDLYIDSEFVDDEDDLLEYTRERRVDGMIVICCDSRYNQGQKMFLQDKRFGSQYWTQFMSNARVFNSKDEAERVRKQFHYNNPCIRRIIDGKLRKVK